MKMKPILEYESVQTAFKGLARKKSKTVEILPLNTKKLYDRVLTYYLEFCNSKVDLKRKWDPDLLLEEARENWRNAGDRIINFFNWLQGTSLEGYKDRPEKIREASARQYAYSVVKGFYTNNEIAFPRTFGTPRAPPATTTSRDRSVEFFTLDEENGKFIFNKDLVKLMLSNLKLRDQAIVLSMLSTSQDAVDLFKLTVGWARSQSKNKRLFWEGQRSKTKVPFKVFFSQEATELVRRYIKQERKNAKADEPLFVVAKNGQTEKMQSYHIRAVLNHMAQEKLGVKNGDGLQNPLRPKRLRHLFRTACTYAGITEEGFIHVFMGHSSTISQKYLETPPLALELEYTKVETFITVYGITESEKVAVLREELQEEKNRRLEMIDRIEALEKRINELTVMSDLEAVEDHIFTRILKKLSK